MAGAKAILKNYRQSPRKVRVVADLVRGKNVAEASVILQHAPKRSAEIVSKLLKSAIANAKNAGIEMSGLKVKEIAVNSGPILYRSRPMSRGRAYRIRKRTSHITLVLDTKQGGSDVQVSKIKKSSEKK